MADFRSKSAIWETASGQRAYNRKSSYALLDFRRLAYNGTTIEHKTGGTEKHMPWPRDSYTGPGGGLYTGPGGGLYTGPGGGAYTGPGGGAYTGPGGGAYTGPGGGLYTGPGGGLYTGPGGGLYTGPGGGLYTGPGGGLYTGPDGGLYRGPSRSPYYSNMPPRKIVLDHLRRRGLTRQYAILKKAWRM